MDKVLIDEKTTVVDLILRTVDCNVGYRDICNLKEGISIGNYKPDLSINVIGRNYMEFLVPDDSTELTIIVNAESSKKGRGWFYIYNENGKILYSLVDRSFNDRHTLTVNGSEFINVGDLVDRKDIIEVIGSKTIRLEMFGDKNFRPYIKTYIKDLRFN